MVWVQIIMQMMCSRILRKSRENESFFDHCEDADGTEKADGSRGQMVQEGRWFKRADGMDHSSLLKRFN